MGEIYMNGDTSYPSQIRWSRYWENSLVGMAILTPDWKLLEVNEALLNLLEYRSEELIERSWNKLIHPDDIRADEGPYNQLVAGDRDRYVLDRLLLRKDGQALSAKVELICLRQVDGSIDQLMAVILDVSERQCTQQQLKKSEDFLENLINAIADPIFVKDSTHHLIVLNEAFCQLIGKSRQELLGKSDREFLPPEQVDLFRERDNWVLSTGVIEETEETLTDSRGKVHIISTKKARFEKTDGEKLLVGTIRETAALKQAEEALRISEERLQMALEGSALGLWDWNIATGETYFDARWKKMLGYQVEEIENTYQSWERLVHPEDISKAIAAINAHLAGDIPLYQVEIRMLNKSGEWQWILAQAKVFEWDESGNPLRMTGTHQDISDRKQAEEALRRSQVQERERYQQLELALQELRNTQTQLVQNEKMVSLGQLVAGIAHEINNPVSFIYSNVSPALEYARDLLDLISLYQQHYPIPVAEIQEEIEIIDLDFLNADFPRLLTSMQQGANRIREIVLSLRNFSRLDEAQMKEADLHSGIKSTLMILQHRLRASEVDKQQPPKAKIQIIEEFGELPKVECYPGQLNQVFLHILSNSIDALEEKIKGDSSFTPTIWIRTELAWSCDRSTRHEVQSAAIRFADNGLGISPTIRSQLFDPFFTTKPVGSGTGLGLSIAHSIVEKKHNGKLYYNSEVGKWTEFAIELPLRSPPEIEDGNGR